MNLTLQIFLEMWYKSIKIEYLKQNCGYLKKLNYKVSSVPYPRKSSDAAGFGTELIVELKNSSTPGKNKFFL